MLIKTINFKMWPYLVLIFYRHRKSWNRFDIRNNIGATRFSIFNDTKLISILWSSSFNSEWMFFDKMINQGLSIEYILKIFRFSSWHYNQMGQFSFQISFIFLFTIANGGSEILSFDLNIVTTPTSSNSPNFFLVLKLIVVSIFSTLSRIFDFSLLIDFVNVIFNKKYVWKCYFKIEEIIITINFFRFLFT